MQTWFPFTDYDFYGYLTSGSVLLFAFDLAFNGGAIAFRPEWTVVQVVLAVALAYTTGQIAAWPSSILLEHLFTHRVLRSPFNIQVGAVRSRLAERAVNALLAGRDYQPLGEDARQKMFERAAAITGRNSSYYSEMPARLFQPAYEFAKTAPQTMQRMDQFRNLYGLMRNLAFASLISALTFGLRAWATDDRQLWTWAAVAVVAGLGTLVRYLKFYGAFATEMTRCFAYHNSSPDMGGE